MKFSISAHISMQLYPESFYLSVLISCPYAFTSFHFLEVLWVSKLITHNFSKVNTNYMRHCYLLICCRGMSSEIGYWEFPLRELETLDIINLKQHIPFLEWLFTIILNCVQLLQILKKIIFIFYSLIVLFTLMLKKDEFWSTDTEIIFRDTDCIKIWLKENLLM